MSRVERAREEKKKGKKKTSMLMLALVVLLALGAGLFIVYGSGVDFFSDDVIDSEKSFSRIDFFNQTYVYVYLDEAGDADRVTAEGEEMAYSPDDGRWVTVLSGYSAGDQVKIAAYSGEKITGEAVLTVEELPLDEE